jgi:hypothetical protein
MGKRTQQRIQKIIDMITAKSKTRPIRTQAMEMMTMIQDVMV